MEIRERCGQQQRHYGSDPYLAVCRSISSNGNEMRYIFVLNSEAGMGRKYYLKRRKQKHKFWIKGSLFQWILLQSLNQWLISQLNVQPEPATFSMYMSMTNKTFISKLRRYSLGTGSSDPGFILLWSSKLFNFSAFFQHYCIPWMYTLLHFH